MGKNKNGEITDHHIIPSSRGGRTNHNIKRVPNGVHNAYHQVFENLTPAEIYDYLAEVWFDPNSSYITPAKWLNKKEY